MMFNIFLIIINLTRPEKNIFNSSKLTFKKIKKWK